MNQDPVTVDRVNWLKLLPGLHLLKAARLGFRVRVLIPAYLALACSLIGAPTEIPAPGMVNHAASPAVSGQLDPTSFCFPFLAFELFGVPRPLTDFVTAGSDLIVGDDQRVLDRWRILVWNMALLCVFGVAIARATATEFCTGTRTGGIESLRFSAKHLPAMLLSSAIAAGIVAMTVMPLTAASLLDVPNSTGSAVVMVFWIFLCLTAVVSVLAAVVCGLGWLLSIGAVGTDQCGGSDALSRSMSYVLSHKLKTVGYLFLVIMVSALARMVTALLVSTSMQLIQSRLPEAFRMAQRGSVDDSGVFQTVLAGSHDFFRLLPNAVHFGTFMAGITLMYIVLREAEDAVQLREIDGARNS